MPLNVPTYRLALDDLDNEHEITVTPGDQLRAETEGNRRGLVDPKAQSVMLTLLWLWAAARRTDLVEKETRFDTFVDRLVAWTFVKPDDGEVATVDPTRQAGSSTPASSSPPDSPASTGSGSSTTTPPSSQPPSDTSSTPMTSSVVPAAGESVLEGAG